MKPPIDLLDRVPVNIVPMTATGRALLIAALQLIWLEGANAAIREQLNAFTVEVDDANRPATCD